MDRIYLSGSEEVSRAGGNMLGAAETMSRAASSIDGSIDSFKRWADEWLRQFVECVDRIEALAAKEATDAKS